MFKNILITIVFALVSFTSVSAIAASADSISVLDIKNSQNNDVALLQVIDSNIEKSENAISQPQALSADNSESILSTEWLFVVALFWFVMLSNRRGV
jgi:hypothetical protein